jgi:hypothetical protein
MLAISRCNRPIEPAIKSSKSRCHNCPTCKKVNEIGHSVEQVEQVGSRAYIATRPEFVLVITRRPAISVISFPSDLKFSEDCSTTSTVSPISLTFFQVGQDWIRNLLDYEQELPA